MVSTSTYKTPRGPHQDVLGPRAECAVFDIESQDYSLRDVGLMPPDSVDPPRASHPSRINRILRSLVEPAQPALK